MSEVSSSVPTIPYVSKTTNGDLPIVVGFILKSKPEDTQYFLNSDESVTDNESMSVNIDESDNENQSERDSFLPHNTNDSRVVGRTDSPAPPTKSRKSCFVKVFMGIMITFSLFAIGNVIYRSL